MNRLTEARTRKELIDPLLAQAGWDVTDREQVGMEIPVDGFDPAAWQRLAATMRALREQGVAYETALPAGVSDYALYRENGEILAVVEARRTSIDPRLSEAQAEFYVEQIGRRQRFQPVAVSAVRAALAEHGGPAEVVFCCFSPEDLLVYQAILG